MDKKKISVYKLAQSTGIAYSTLSNIVNGKTDIQSVSAKVLYKLAKGLDLSMEQLYLNCETDPVAYLSNTGRNVEIYLNGDRFSYLGPKNLVGFRNVSALKNNVIYVDTYFKDPKGKIYVEEDYIDLNDICSSKKEILDMHYKIMIGKPGESRKDHLMNNALLVSDNMAVLLDECSTDDVVVEVVNIKRNREKLLMRIADYSVLYTDMSRNMQMRAELAVKNNISLIQTEIKERMHA
jgi:transcriptional regulator with XRE-family HTH domain